MPSLTDTNNNFDNDGLTTKNGPFERYTHQAGGHCCILKFDGRICKPLVPKEYDFYRTVHLYPQIISIVPEFFGHIRASSNNAHVISDREVVPQIDLNECYIVLQDLTAGMRRPCVMDMKMGTYRQRFETSVTLGYRLCGMRVWRGDELYSVDRLFGRGLTVETVDNAIGAFFFNGRFTVTRLIPPLLKKLRMMAEMVASCPYRFYTSSLLLIYDGDAVDDDEGEPFIDVRIVDFAHAIYKGTVEGESDDGFLFGLHNLSRLFERIMERYSDSEESGSSSECDSDIDSVDNGNNSSIIDNMDTTTLVGSYTHSRCAPFPINTPTPVEQHSVGSN